MILNRPLWTILGIEPTTDRRLIRKAYAARLKVTHPEDDAQAFQELRTAYEIAMAHADQLVAAVPVDVPADERGSESPPAQMRTEPAMSQPMQPPQANPDETSAWDAFAQLQRDLASAKPMDRQHVERDVMALLSVVRECNVTVQGAFEDALARVLANSLPQADFLLEPIAQRLGWSRSLDQSREPAIAAVMDRLQALEVESVLAAGNHPLSGAYRALQGEPRPRAWRARAVLGALDDKVKKLLLIARHEHPALLISFNGASVEWWTKYLEGRRLTRSTLIVLAIAVAMILYGSGDSTVTLGVPKLTWLWVMFVVAGALLFGDWALPRILRRWAAHIDPIDKRIAWLPFALLAVVLAGLLPDSVALFACFPVAALAIPWAIAAESGYIGNAALDDIVGWRVLLNVPMSVLLWVLFARSEGPGVGLTALAAVVAQSCGHNVSANVLLGPLNPEQRNIARSVSALTLVLGMVAIWALQIRAVTMLAITVALVLLHRPVSALLSVGAQRVRYFIQAVPFVIGGVYVLTEKDVNGVPLLATWFLLGLLLTLFLAQVEPQRS